MLNEEDLGGGIPLAEARPGALRVYFSESPRGVINRDIPRLITPDKGTRRIRSGEPPERAHKGFVEP